MSASPVCGSGLRRKCAGDSVTITSRVGRTNASRRWPPWALPSDLATTTCGCSVALPSPSAISPIRLTTSTCSSTGNALVPPRAKLEEPQHHPAEATDAGELAGAEPVGARELLQRLEEVVAAVEDQRVDALRPVLDQSRLHRASHQLAHAVRQDGEADLAAVRGAAREGLGEFFRLIERDLGRHGGLVRID